MSETNFSAKNVSRGSSLGDEIRRLDLPYVRLRDVFASLALKPGEGYWIAPFNGLPNADPRQIVDLVALHEDGRVMNVVENFPSTPASFSVATVASVLVLPQRTVVRSNSRVGDHIEIRNAGQSTSVLRQEYELENQSKPASASHQPQASSKDAGDTERGRQFKVKRSWLDRMLSPDPRRSSRHQLDGLVAYYWDGSNSTARPVRDVSLTGFYLLTEERWYPGTMVMMTLQRSACPESDPHRSCTILCEVMRNDQDGIGLKFLPGQRQSGDMGKVTEAKDLRNFLLRIQPDLE